MNIWLQNKMQKSTKVLALVLFLLCSQLSLASHVHAESDVALEACSVCLIGQAAEFDDALFSNSTNSYHLKTFTNSYHNQKNTFDCDNAPLTIRLRGPPA